MKTINFNKFIGDAVKSARETDTPISGSFELTPLCNLDCKMCYVHLSDPTVKARMLSGDEWIALMEQAIGHGMINALLTGGEAMTHPDFVKIYMYLIEQGVSVRLKTNGILLDREKIDLFTEYPPYVVDVSLYGCDGESYRAVTGHDVFDTVTENIRAAIKAGLHVRLMITPSAYMLPWVDQIMEYAKTFGAEDVNVNIGLMEANPDTDRRMEDFGLSLEENARIHRKQRDMFPRAPRSQTEEEAEFMGDIPEDEPHILPRGLYCNGGRTGFAMNFNHLLSEMCGRRNALKAEGKSAFSPDTLAKYLLRYDELLGKGLEHNPIPDAIRGKRGRRVKGKTRCLLERLRDYKTDILRFAVDWDVPFTNNEAERCVRFSKVKEKISGCFRTRDGADGFMRLMSYIGTAKKHKVSAYDALLEAVNGSALQMVSAWA